MCSIAFATGEVGSFFAAILAYPGAPDSQLGVVAVGMRLCHGLRDTPLNNRQWWDIPRGTTIPWGHLAQPHTVGVLDGHH